MTVYILIGPPCSGKSTFKKLYFKKAFNICRDDILMSMSPNISYTDAFNVVNVPTIIVMKDGKELGRVVEYGNTGKWDKELADILNK